MELKPCPFCGGKNVCERADDGYVSCADCHAYGPDAQNAIKGWNTRPTADLGEDGELVERLREFGSYPADETARGYISKYIALCQQAADRLFLYMEALDDAVATIAAVRATTAGAGWAEAAKHFHDVCGETLKRIDAVLSRSGG
jgi:hypothetical protein